MLMKLRILALVAVVLVPTQASADLLSRAMRDMGRNPTGWSHQWCGRMMAMWAGGGPDKASEWRHRGKATRARPGAVAVMAHHVGVVVSCTSSTCRVIGGNHSGKSGRRTVGIGTYSKSKIIAFRAL